MHACLIVLRTLLCIPVGSFPLVYLFGMLQPLLYTTWLGTNVHSLIMCVILMHV